MMHRNQSFNFTNLTEIQFQINHPSRVTLSLQWIIYPPQHHNAHTYHPVSLTSSAQTRDAKFFVTTLHQTHQEIGNHYIAKK